MEFIAKFFFIENQKVVLFSKFRKNGWEVATSTLTGKCYNFLWTLGIKYLKSIIILRVNKARLAQLVERKALNLVVVGSSPTVGA